MAAVLRSTRRRRMVLVTTLASLVLLTGVALYGCATTIVAPAHVRDPVTVYLVDYGYHSRVVMPYTQRAVIEYSYGEWLWFALGYNRSWDMFRALLVPSEGTLGRRVLDDPLHATWWDELEFVALFDIQVEREHVEALLAKLHERWTAAAETRVYNPVHDMEFVHDPRRYHLFTNSNRVSASWLEELGCEIRGWALVSNWRVEKPE
jgi:hypothetical protein